MSDDPRMTLAAAPMSRVQIVAVAIMAALNGLDGFDVLSISFASPGISADWHIDRAALGVVLSMELIGMALGSVVLGNLTDRLGRRPLILLCLVLMSVGMFMGTSAHGVVALSLWRVFTGVGIGGMLAATNAMVAEYANEKSRSLAVSIMAAGYPIGAVVGGTVAAYLLKAHDWHSIFLFGGAITAAFLPLVWFAVPETISFLCQKRPDDALDRVNRALERMGHASVEGLPPQQESRQRSAIGELFKAGRLKTTILVTLAYFAHITTFYFILKWVPKIVVDMGFVPAAAAGVLVWANVGGATGGTLLGLASRRLSLRGLTIGALAASVIMVSFFGRGQSNLATLSLIVAAAGFFTNAGVVGLYAIFAQSFPTALRASGTGFAIGVGRGGAALSPIIAGRLFENGVSLQGVAVAMASGAAIAAIAVFLLPKPEFARGDLVVD